MGGSRRSVLSPKISPDETRIAFIEVEEREKESFDNLWVCDFRKDLLKKLYQGPEKPKFGGAGDLTWSPDVLVEMEPNRGLPDHVALWLELPEILGRKVDAVSDWEVKPPIRERALREAVPLCRKVPLSHNCALIFGVAKMNGFRIIFAVGRPFCRREIFTRSQPGRWRKTVSPNPPGRIIEQAKRVE